MPTSPNASSLIRHALGLGLVLAAASPALAATVKTERILVDPPAAAPAPLGDGQTPPGALETPVAPPPDATAPQQEPGAGAPAAAAGGETALPVVSYGEEGLPKPVQRIRAQMLDAARSGDIEKLRPVLEANEVPPTLAFETIDDPISYLKDSSGDPDGREILAILTEVLEAGWVHVDVGTAQEMYIWPYFYRYPLETLDGPQMVELFKLVTAADFDEMKSYGAYIFYRVGIGPDGTWHYFVAGD